MMLTVRRTEERGQAEHGWLHSRHSFSFGQYFDPNHLGFSDLKVINEDVVEPGAGFGTHPHADMEILTYVISGALAHTDSMGNREVLTAGTFQRMTAGTGITHSEMNASDTVPVHFLQIWIEPDQNGLAPDYEERSLANLPQGLTKIAGQGGGENALTLHQDAAVYTGSLTAGSYATLDLAPGRSAWVQVISGGLTVNGQRLRPGDGLALTDETALDFSALADAHFLVFDLR